MPATDASDIITQNIQVTYTKIHIGYIYLFKY